MRCLMGRLDVLANWHAECVVCTQERENRMNANAQSQVFREVSQIPTLINIYI